MCKNSPAPGKKNSYTLFKFFFLKTIMFSIFFSEHSMWSDGSPQLNTNFAPDSGLDGSHCCIKIEMSTDHNNNSWWRGESCETMLQGICEFEVEEYLDTPRYHPYIT